MPEQLAALIEVFLQNPGHSFDYTTISRVLQELAIVIPALEFSEHNDPLDLIQKLLSWLDSCGVKIHVVAEHTDSCQKCKLKDVRPSKTPNVFALALLRARESLTSLFEQAIMEGDGLRTCTSCGTVMKRQVCWLDSPDVITMSMCRVAKGGRRVIYSSVVPADVIGIAIRGGNKIKYKLVSIICHSGSDASSGHFWAHLNHGTDVIKANDTSIEIIPLKIAEKNKNKNGCEM